MVQEITTLSKLGYFFGQKKKRVCRFVMNDLNVFVSLCTYLCENRPLRVFGSNAVAA